MRQIFFIFLLCLDVCVVTRNRIDYSNCAKENHIRFQTTRILTRKQESRQITTTKQTK